MRVNWPEVRVVYIFGSWNSNPAKPTSGWLEKNLRAVSYGRIHVTNFKTLSSQTLCTKAPYEALRKLYQKLYQKLY